MEKYGKRTIKVTKEHNEECKKLLRLMGVPVVEAPCEAEASCAALCMAGRVYAAASEDMDTLTFGTVKLARNLMKPASADNPILEFDYATALRELGLTREQFVDLCILCGCDYTDAIRGIGPVTALKLMKEHGSIERVLQHLKDSGSKAQVPDPFPYEGARRLFLQPEVVDAASLPEFKWSPPDEEALVAFLVGEKSFSEERVRKAVEKMKAAKSKASQNRMEAFFGCVASGALRVTAVYLLQLTCSNLLNLHDVLFRAQRSDGDQVDHGAEAAGGGRQGQGQGGQGRGRGRQEVQGRWRRQEVGGTRTNNARARRNSCVTSSPDDGQAGATFSCHFFHGMPGAGCCGGCCGGWRGRGVSSSML